MFGRKSKKWDESATGKNSNANKNDAVKIIAAGIAASGKSELHHIPKEAIRMSEAIDELLSKPEET